jgi:hypothetical protein
MEKKTVPDQREQSDSADAKELIFQVEDSCPPACDPPAVDPPTVMSPEDEDLLHLPPVVKSQSG